MTEPKHLFLVDGSGFIFRAFHALPPLTRRDGTPAGAVYGFLNMMIKLMEGTKADYIGVIFDKSRITFRNRLYEQYKANRSETPEDLIPQFPLVHEATEALGIAALEMDDYEADDLIATYAKQGRERGMDVTIVSSDKDLMQLIGEGVRLYDPMKMKPIGEAEVMEKFGVPPHQVLDVLSLIGDTSDNVPGVPGIGPKTAAELIAQFGSLDAILERAGEIKQNKRRESLIQYADQARLSRDLITLCEDAPLPATLDELALREPDHQKLVDFVRRMEFKTLLSRLESKFGISVAAAPADAAVASTEFSKEYELVQDAQQLEAWIAKARAAGRVAFDTETTSLDAMAAQIVGFSLSVEAGKACYVPLCHVGEGSISDAPTQGDLWSAAPAKPKLLPGQMDMNAAFALLGPLLADASVLKIGQNIKYDMLVLQKYGLNVAALDDTMLLSYTLAAGKHAHNMDELSNRYLGHAPIAYKEVTGSGKSQISFTQVSLEKARDYAAEDADVTLRLWEVLKPQLAAERLTSVYETIERPLVPVLVGMEAKGIKVDTDVLSSLSNDFGQKMTVLEANILRMAGQEFNVGSPKQLGEVLFESMGLPGGKKSSKTGAYNTGAEVLEELALAGHELPARVLDWRQLAKLKSTYTDSLMKQINPNTGRVHTSYAMAIASTGRLSSTDPNLQNIPIRSEEGKKIRTAFIAESGHKLLSADYSQIELRLLAEIANIETLKTAFRNGDDIHAITASQMFGKPLSDIDSNLRRQAKTINFGIIYGISAHGLATRLGISRTEAATYIEAYFKQYPGIKEYMEHWKVFAREHGYVTTLYGRRVHVPGILDKNPNMRGFSERAAINAPLQGTAADIIKKAMIRIDRKLRDHIPGASMLLQVHDELVFEAPESDMAALVTLVKTEMEASDRVSIPLVVETGVGDNWGAIH